MIHQYCFVNTSHIFIITKTFISKNENSVKCFYFFVEMDAERAWQFIFHTSEEKNIKKTMKYKFTLLLRINTLFVSF